ncbi:hypothetical protein GP486_000129 [Trichoglossum hirsutum]|uniref:Uncharacterized protein n=1 Tax=Trichoglossum hirsutum TaxID=265104 RepID=A0A9P8LJ83_9PEZI|nr:hypothetical protein GP486_000129 [Trichoglossum hirsutum]
MNIDRFRAPKTFDNFGDMANQLAQATTQQQWPADNKSKNTKLSTRFIEFRPSAVLSILPSSVKSRLPQLPSLQKSASRNLLSSAMEESLQESQDAPDRDPALTRQLYIHSLTYLLRGLPKDLSAEERLDLRSALPSGVTEPLRLDIDDQNVVTIRDSERKIRNGTSSTPSLLHRITASLVIQLIVFAHFILPHIKALLRNAYIYERNNRLSERVLAKSIDTVDTVGKKGIEFGEAVARIGDGKLGQALNGVAVWCAEGVAGGIYEGVGEGIVIVSAKNQRLASDAQM